MDLKIKEALRKKRIAEMQNPIILMNKEDFENFKKETELITNIKVGDNPKYEGIPIKISDILGKGVIIVYEKCERCKDNVAIINRNLCASCYVDIYGIDQADC